MELTCKIQQPSIGLPLAPRANELFGGLDTIEENLSCRNEAQTRWLLLSNNHGASGEADLLQLHTPLWVPWHTVFGGRTIRHCPTTVAATRVHPQAEVLSAEHASSKPATCCVKKHRGDPQRAARIKLFYHCLGVIQKTHLTYMLQMRVRSSAMCLCEANCSITSGPHRASAC